MGLSAQKFGLSDAEMTILYILYETGDGCPQREIYSNTGISKSTINSAIKKMESEGIITLNAKDGRSTAVYITNIGKQLLKRTIEKIFLLRIPYMTVGAQKILLRSGCAYPGTEICHWLNCLQTSNPAFK